MCVDQTNIHHKLLKVSVDLVSLHYQMFMVVRINQNQRQELQVRSFCDIIDQKRIKRVLTGVN